MLILIKNVWILNFVWLCMFLIVWKLKLVFLNWFFYIFMVYGIVILVFYKREYFELIINVLIYYVIYL